MFVRLVSSLIFISSICFAQSQNVNVASSKPIIGDGQIAKILVTINEGELEAAKWAEKHADHKDVKAFAKDMKAGHEKNLKATKDLAKKSNFKLDESDLSKTLTEEASASNANLKTQKGSTLDKAYVDQQITMHTNALAHLNNTLIPNAGSADLRVHLEKTRDEVAAHLTHVQNIKTKIQ